MLLNEADTLQDVPFPLGLCLHLIHGSLGPPESDPKRHLDRFSHFAQLTSVTNRQSDIASVLDGNDLCLVEGCDVLCWSVSRS